MIYFIILILLILPVIIYDVLGYNKGMNIWYVFEFTILVLLAGLRYRVGGDTLFYMSFFDYYPNFKDLFEFDFAGAEFNPLWYIFNAITKFISDDFTTFQIIQAIVVNSVFFWFFKKYTKYYFSAILMYFFGYYCYFNMEVLREVLALCCLMLSVPALNKRNYFVYYIWCIVGILFHYSAFFMLLFPLFQLIFKNITWKQLIIILVGMGLVLSSINIMPFILDAVSFNDLIAIRMEDYLDSAVNLTNILFYYGTILPIVVILYINGKRNPTFNINQIKGLIITYAILMIFSSFFHTVFTRLSNYLIPFYIIYLIDSFYTIIKNYRLSLHAFYIRIALFIVLFFQSYYYWSDQSKFYPGAHFYTLYYPYYSVLNPTIDQPREVFFSNFRNSDDF
jgi:hypothetical protein